MVRHLSIIMDGNRRWEKTHNVGPYDGYRKGAEIMQNIAEAAIDWKIPYLTVYAFSYENWMRPIREIATIMNIGMEWLDAHRTYMRAKNIRCRVIGNRELLPYWVLNRVEEIEQETSSNTGLNFQIALSYGARDEIVRACMKIGKAMMGKKSVISEDEFSKMLDTADIPDPDLLIRTGGQKRLSNYMLWQLAYTEIYFEDKLWPDFTREDLARALEEFEGRQRRFGR